jgi:hypothetical protein
MISSFTAVAVLGSQKRTNSGMFLIGGAFSAGISTIAMAKKKSLRTNRCNGPYAYPYNSDIH